VLFLHDKVEFWKKRSHIDPHILSGSW